MNRWTMRALLRSSMPLVATALVLSSVGCDSLLEVEDPVNLTPEDLAGGAPVELTVNGMRGAFQDMIDNYILHTGMMTDEFILAGTFPYRQEIDERATTTNNEGLLGELYSPLSVSRFMADTSVVILSDALNQEGFDEGELRSGIALGTYFGGYARMLLAEAFCESPIAGGSILPSDERMRDALSVFQEAESAGQSSGDTDIVNAAKVGQARAHLWLGELSQATTVAATVPSSFEFMARYSGNSVGQYNRVADITHALDDVIRWTVPDGSLSFTGEEKWPYFDEWVELGLLIPRPDLEAFNPSVPVVLQMKYTKAEDPITIASGAEADLIEAEVLLRNGDTAGAASIVNTLRAGWELDPVSFSGTAAQDLPVIVRERARELYLTGERLGTFRRLLDDGIDLFPTGKIGNQTCFPLPERETDTNTNA